MHVLLDQCVRSCARVDKVLSRPLPAADNNRIHLYNVNPAGKAEVRLIFNKVTAIFAVKAYFLCICFFYLNCVYPMIQKITFWMGKSNNSAPSHSHNTVSSD